MKLFRKLTVLVLAIVFVLSLATGVFAAENGKVNIIIENAIAGATYSGYRILDTTTSLKSQNCHSTDEEHQSTCYNIAYSVNDKYEALLKNVTEATTDEGIIEYIGAQTSVEQTRAFADAVYNQLGAITADKTKKADTATVTLDNIDSGYWLIVETINDEKYNGAYSLVILDTVGSRNVTVSTKRDEPALEKFVRDNGMNYGQGADIQIGDQAEFLLRTDVPNPIGYTVYNYVIHDNLSAGLCDPNQFEVRVANVEGTPLSDAYYNVIFTGLCEDCDFHVEVDIQQATIDGVLKADDRLYVTYKATLNDKANVMVTGQDTKNANPNTAWLEYSNSPYDPDSTTTSTPMTVYVWTMPLELNKVDNAGVNLEGAKFVLSRNGSLTESQLKDLNNDNKPDGFAEMMPLIKKDNNTYMIAPTGYTGDVVYEIDAGTAKIQGFDDQVEYYLYETAAPAGYNKLNTPVSVKFFASYVSSESPFMAEGYPKVSINTATETSNLKANVVNQTGAELPSTGGIGTTIFYVLGGAMVLAAVVLLITKKRMGADS